MTQDLEPGKLPSRSERHKKQPTTDHVEVTTNDIDYMDEDHEIDTAIRIKPLLAIAFLIIVLLGSAFGGYRYVGGGEKTPIDISTLPVREQEAVRQEWAGKNINLLLVGADQREGEVARADTIIIATLRPVTREVSLVSLPRDTYLNIAGRTGKDKINHAYVYGGEAMLQKTIENYLDIKIDHYVLINFDGFINAINALGGVTIDVEKRMYKPLEYIDLKPGVQKLNGNDALAYVRWRGDGTGDFGRIERQQKFIAAITDELKVMSLKEALNAAGAIMNGLQTDMSIGTMTKLAKNFIGISSTDITFESFGGEPVMYNDVSYVELKKDTVTEVMRRMKYGPNIDKEEASTTTETTETTESTN